MLICESFHWVHIYLWVRLHCEVHGFEEQLTGHLIILYIGFESTASIIHFTLQGAFHNSSHIKFSFKSSVVLTNPSKVIVCMTSDDSGKTERLFEVILVYIIWKHMHFDNPILNNSSLSMSMTHWRAISFIWFPHMQVSYTEFDISQLRLAIQILVEHKWNHLLQ